jgi:hypothetical protein
MEETNRRQRRMEASPEGNQGPERSVVIDGMGSHKRHDFGKKVITGVLIFSANFDRSISHSKKN